MIVNDFMSRTMINANDAQLHRLLPVLSFSVFLFSEDVVGIWIILLLWHLWHLFWTWLSIHIHFAEVTHSFHNVLKVCDRSLSQVHLQPPHKSYHCSLFLFGTYRKQNSVKGTLKLASQSRKYFTITEEFSIFYLNAK